MKNVIIVFALSLVANIVFSQKAHFVESIKASYPENGQFNFYPNENSSKIGHFVLTENDKFLAKSKMPLRMIFEDTEGKQTETKGKYDIEKLALFFDIPEDLKNEEMYKLSFFFNKTEWHTIYFRTSKYDSFFEKIKAINFEFDSVKCVSAATIDEPFEDAEVAAMNSEENKFITLKLEGNWRDPLHPIYTDGFYNFLDYPDKKSFNANGIVDSIVQVAKEIHAKRKKLEQELEEVKDDRWKRTQKRNEIQMLRRSSKHNLNTGKEDVLVNGYKIPKRPELNSQIEFSQKAKVGRVSVKDFNKKKVFKVKPAKLKILVPDICALKPVFDLCQSYIPIREKEIEGQLQELMAYFEAKGVDESILSRENFERKISARKSENVENLSKAKSIISEFKYSFTRELPNFDQTTSHLSVPIN